MPKKTPDLLILFSFLTLISLGLIMVFSATPSTAFEAGDIFYYFKKHLFYIILAILALDLGWRFDLKKLRRYSPIIFLTSLLLLILLFIPGLGKTAGGATRWYAFASLSFQPSEFAKLTLILFLAHIICNKGEKIKDAAAGLLPPLCLTMAPAILVFGQPDLGSAIMLVLIALSMLFSGGARLWHLIIIFLLSVQTALALSLSSAYRLKRLLAFMDPWKDPLGIGFNIIQSLLAVGSGGFLGAGLGASSQKFFYLPGQYTDFIFAILCEELGFVGASVTVILFLILVVRGLRTAYLTSDNYSRLVACGIAAWIGFQALINLGVVLSLVPATGIPLPFISFGGTSLFFSSLAVGILLKISAQPQENHKA
jgi:cell division protein FtsW